jgi:hypothetical protein
MDIVGETTRPDAIMRACAQRLGLSSSNSDQLETVSGGKKAPKPHTKIQGK